MSSSSDAQRQVEETRARMSAELDALAYKLDVPSRAKERVAGASRRVRRAAPSGGDIKGSAENNPLGMVIGGVAAGFLAGLLIPNTKMEDEQLGPIADRVRDEAVATGREAVERGKSVARVAADAAKESAQTAGRQQGEAMKSTAAARASSVSDARR